MIEFFMKTKKGQILLITIMALATILTVVFAVSFQSQNDTRLTKAEEEAQKALAAAESAAENAIKTGNTVTIGEGLLSMFDNMTGIATVETVVTNTFTTPLISRDAAYTFYLADYNIATNTFGVSSSEPVTLCFDDALPKPALELTLVKTSGLKKYVVDPNSAINNASPSAGACGVNSSFEYSYVIPGADIGVDAKLLYARVLYSPTRLILSRASNLPIQGKTSRSEVTTNIGVSKKVILFQSYPQIPAEFFATTY